MTIETVSISDAVSASQPIAADLVGGAYYQVTKVSFGSDGAVTLVDGSNGLPVAIVGSVPVTGTFWQATQPVSIASMPSTPVTGTFWQATQPVSGTLAVSNFPANQSVNINQATPGVTNGVQINALTYPSSTANSSSSQLAAGATFTGTVETILSLQAAQVEIVCDQPYTLTVYQYIDAAGLQLSSTDVFTRAANVPTNENITLPGNYFKLSVTNNGLAATTNLVINTTFGIMATSPRTITTLGNARNSINEINGAPFSLGQATAAGSLPVVLASNQSTIPVSASNIDIETPASTRIVGNPDGDYAGLDLLEQVLDPATGLRVQVDAATGNKVDAQKALVLSDAPAPINISGAVNTVYIIDTIGYQSLNVTSQTFAASVTGSDDGVTWSALNGSPRVYGNLTTAITAGAGFNFPCLARYIRFVFTTAGTGVAYLRAQPWGAAHSNNQGVNITQIGGGNSLSGVGGVMAVSGANAVGVAQTTNPLVVGGIDSSSLTRRLLTDTSGRAVTANTAVDPFGTQRQIGVLTPASSPQNIAPLSVVDSLTTEGANNAELLALVLTELKILNHQLFELPRLLNVGAAAYDQPEAFRNDSTVFQ